MSVITQAATQMQLQPSAQSLLTAGMSPHAAVQALLDADYPQDALKLLARLLPKRYAVAWLCQCAAGLTLDARDRLGLSLAQAWVSEPDESHRRAALDFATADRCRSIGAWLAAAAGWSSGSVGPLGHEPPAPAAEHLTACAAVAAITRLSALVITQFVERRDRFVRRALSLLPTSATDLEAEA